MRKYRVSMLCLTALILFSGCDRSIQDPNVMFSEKHKDPIQELEKTSKETTSTSTKEVRKISTIRLES